MGNILGELNLMETYDCVRIESKKTFLVFAKLVLFSYTVQSVRKPKKFGMDFLSIMIANCRSTNKADTLSMDVQ